ncbi:MAG TPA: IPT/TIG domain-containing protein [Acidimicrobiales bacterium]|nr:IPT/TIG domain-containing protein [Acidimicrobiales bacterium]
MTSISPTSGLALLGTAVTIVGTHLSGATAVNFGGSPGTITADSATSITVTTPLLGLGTVSVTVTTPGGTATAPQQYTYTLLGIPLLAFTPSAIGHHRTVATPAVTLVDHLTPSTHTSWPSDRPAAGAAEVRLVSATATAAPTYQLMSYEQQASASACVSFCQLVSINGSTCASNSISSAALAANLNALGILTTDAELANGQNALNLTTALNIPGVASASLVTTVIQPAQYAYGQAPATLASAGQLASACTNRTFLSGQTYACTSQVNIDLQLSILGLATIDIPISAASGWAALSSVTCTNNVMTTTQIEAATTAASADITAGLLGGTTVLAGLTINGASPSVLTYTVPTPSTQTISASALTVAAKGILGLLNPVLGTVLGAVTPLLTPLLQALGVSVAGADVTDLSTNCAAVKVIP